MPQSDSTLQRRHLMTLCHTDDCCPEIFYVEANSVDACLEVTDDFGNHAFFGPDTLLQAELKPMTGGPQPDLWILRDSFGNEVYMQVGQYGVMLNEANIALIKDVARQRQVFVRGLVNQARARMRNLALA